MNIAKWPIFQCWAHCCDDVCWCLCIGQSPVPGITIPPPGVMKAAAVTTLTCHFHIIFCLLHCSCAGHPGAKMASNDWLEDISSVTCLFSVSSCCTHFYSLLKYIFNLFWLKFGTPCSILKSILTVLLNLIMAHTFLVSTLLLWCSLIQIQTGS